MLKYFNDLFSYNFTNHMEKSLDKIAEGSILWKDVIKELWNSYKDRYEQMLQDKSESKSESKKVKHFQPYKAVQTKNGPLLLQEYVDKPTIFLGWPKDVSFEDITEIQVHEFIQKQEQKEQIGEWNNTPIIKKSGKFGPYFQCNNITIPFQEEPLEKTIERFQEKSNAKMGEKIFKDYVIRTGMYGPYIMKTSLKKAQFVSLPKGISIETITEKEVDALYKMGQEEKKAKKHKEK